MACEKRYWPYGRFSSGEQKDGDSENRQTSAFDLWLKRRDVDRRLVQATIFDQGLSGFHGRHLRDGGGLAQFLVQIDSGVVRSGDVLIVENFDRLSRLRPTDAQELILRVTGAGVTIAIVDGDYEINTRKINSGDGTLWRLIGEIERAHRESARKSVFTSRNWSEKRHRAEEGVRTKHKHPAWLAWDDNKRAYVKVADRCRTVETIYKLARTMGAKAITRHLNERIRDHRPFGSLAYWSEVYVQKIMRSRAAVGEIEFNETVSDEDGYAELDQRGRKTYRQAVVIPGYYPRAVSDKLWADVAARREQRAFCSTGGKLDEVPNLLTGRIVCARCGSAMHIVQSQRDLASGETRHYTYYKCSTHKASGKHGCDVAQTWTKIEVEKLVVGFLLSDLDPAVLTGNEDDRSRVSDLRSEMERHDQEIDRLTERIGNWTEALASLTGRAQDAITQKLNDAHESVGRLTAESAKIKAEIERAATVGDDMTLARRQLSKLDLAVHEDRARIRTALSPIVDRVVVDSANRTISIRVRGLPRHATVVVDNDGRPVGMNVSSEKEARLMRALLARR